jgi:hypothetical protein
MSAMNLKVDAGLALEEFVQKLERLTHAQVEAIQAALSSREEALNERERQLNERERALDERSASMESRAAAEARMDVDEKLLAHLANTDQQAMLKITEPDRAKAALMVPSPTRGRTSMSLKNGDLPPTAPKQPFSSPPHRSSQALTVPPCSPPVATPVAIVGNQAASSSPMPEEIEEAGSARKVHTGAVQVAKMKLLTALNSGGFQASPGADESMNTSVNISAVNTSAVNTSIISTPGRNSNIGAAGKPKVERKSLAELLKEDEVRLAQLRPSQC